MPFFNRLKKLSIVLGSPAQVYFGTAMIPATPHDKASKSLIHCQQSFWFFSNLTFLTTQE